MTKERLEQSGAVVYRVKDGEPLVLIVGATKTSGGWVFPKGHLRPDESREAAALRESLEEAGVIGDIVCPLGALEFRSGDEDVRVHYYLVRLRSESSISEPRPKQWLTPKQAAKTLSHEDARQLLRGALELIDYDISVARLRASPACASTGSFTQLLFAEYAHAADSLLRNEQDGEERAAFFVTVAVAAGGVLTFAVGKNFVIGPADVHPLVVLTLLVILVLGYFTLARLANRNRSTDRYKHRLNRVRRFFVDGPEDARRCFLAFDPFVPGIRPLPEWRSIGRGGWLETVAAAEALLMGALAATLVRAESWWIDGLIGAVAAAVGWVLLMQRAKAAAQQSD